MRLCRFVMDEVTLVGFYEDDRVIPLDQAAEAYSQETGVELDLPATEDLIDFLPPDGGGFEAARELANWIEELEDGALEELSVPVDDVRLLVPIGRPGKLLLLAGNYAAH